MRLAGRQLVRVFLTKLKFNLRSEASKTYLGYIWWILEPALFVAVLYLIFGTFRARGNPEFVFFLVCGMLPFLWFSKSVTNSSRSILTGKGLINQVSIHKAFFPLLSISENLVKQVFVFILMLVLLLSYGLEPDLSWLYLFILIIVQLLVIVACALIVAAIIPFVPDFHYIIATGMTLLLLVSGLFFDYRTLVLPEHQELFLLNPMARLIKNYRQVLMDNLQPDWLALGILAAGCAVVIFGMLALYRRLDTAFARAVS